MCPIERLFENGPKINSTNKKNRIFQSYEANVQNENDTIYLMQIEESINGKKKTGCPISWTSHEFSLFFLTEDPAFSNGG